jgi:hypothetical protein
MIIRTVKQRGEFAILPKAAINDDRLSWEALGVLAYLLSKPDGWQVNLKHLVKRGRAQDHKVRRIVAELEDAGYMVRRRQNGEGGKWTWVTEIYETPQQVVQPSSENHYMVDESDQPSRDYPRMDKPHVDDPYVDKPYVDNREIYYQRENLESTLVIPEQNQEQQQQHAVPVSGHAAAAVSLTSEQRAALALLGVAAPAFTAPETFVRRYDPRLIGYWCIAVDSMTGFELEAIKSIPAFLYAMVKKGDWPALAGRQVDRWTETVDSIAGDAPEELNY